MLNKKLFPMFILPFNYLDTIFNEDTIEIMKISKEILI